MQLIGGEVVAEMLNNQRVRFLTLSYVSLPCLNDSPPPPYMAQKVWDLEYP
jgi:hypothetical protein